MSNAVAPPPNKFTLSALRTTGTNLPGRYVIHGPEGSGKTSLGAQMPSPVFLQSRGETGLETLLDAKRLKDTPHFAQAETWDDLLDQIAAVRHEPHEYRTLVLDTCNGAERLCHDYVCKKHFKGQMTEEGFLSYNKGYEVSLTEWQSLLAALDDLRTARKMAVALLCHTAIRPFKNPEGPDYDRFTPDMHAKTWSLTHKWADAVLFLNYETFVEKERNTTRAKGKGGTQRIMYTERTAAYDAKNRFGLPAEILLGNSPQDAWAAFVAARKEAANTEKT